MDQRVKRTMVAVLGALALLAAACGDDDDTATTTTTTSPATTVTTTTTDGTTTTAPATTSVPDEELDEVSVYFLMGEELATGEGREPTTEGVVAEALEALLAGPSAFEEEIGMTTAVPAGTRLLGVTLEGGVADVDLSGEFESGGGSLSMVARVAQVVFTATQFSQVDAVRFLIDGETVDAIGGEGVVVDEPLGREAFDWDGGFGDLGLFPSILVESPRPNDEIDSPVRITGSANVFEATFLVEITDGEGLIVAEEVVTATSGTGTRGTFDVTVPFEPQRPGFGAIITFFESAKDGSRQDVREMPVRVG
jgi:germination protein M